MAYSLRRVVSRVVGLGIVIVGLVEACSPPEYEVASTSHSGGRQSTSSTGGSDSGGASVGGLGSMAGSGNTGGLGLETLDCNEDRDCQRFVATRICDTAVKRCVECLPGRTTCNTGLYCGADKECHVGCAANSDCKTGVCNTAENVCSNCEKDVDCASGTRCEVASGSCIPGCGSAEDCPSSWTCCGGVCVNPELDEENCGSCSTSCDRDHTSAECRDARCVVTGCGQGWGDCNDKATDGCEVNLLVQADHCSACGQRCTLPNATATCTEGKCSVASCSPNWADCNQAAEDGCETNLLEAAQHCGSCDVVCGNSNGTASCKQGKCTIECLTNFGDCDGVNANGCEADLLRTVAHCSACSYACVGTPNATATCTDGACGFSNCAPPYGDCDHNESNGCESNAKVDVANCGGCGTRCDLAHATPTCNDGVCAIGACAAGWADCNGIVADGCEVNIQTSLANCGACGASCAPANAVGACNLGVCSITSCASGYRDCNKELGDGCEIDTTSNTNHCGACGNVCSSAHGTPSCSQSVCSISCATGYGDCDGKVSTGCEAETTSSLDHCGGCGKACAPKNATGSCQSSICSIATCSSGYRDCDSSSSNGCEVNIDSDPANCGACKNVCNSTNGKATCTTGACGISCNTGFGDCDKDLKNGCEIDTTTDEGNCGACGAVCATTCTASTCAKPCTGLCTNPTPITSLSPPPQITLSTAAFCYEMSLPLAGGGCYNIGTRPFYINGTAMVCNAWAIPGATNGGYCFYGPAGTAGSFTIW